MTKQGASPNRTNESDIAAANWDARLRATDCTQSERDSFKLWYDSNPANAEAFDSLQLLLNALRSNIQHPELRGLRDRALSVGSTTAASRKNLARWLGIAASLTIVFSALTLLISGEDSLAPSKKSEEHIQAFLPPFYATSVGSQEKVSLTDGSLITLNTNSLVHVRYSADERRISLVKGQALFEVEKDPTRPFIVEAGDQEILAVGTVFDVRLDDETVSVVLVEGEVEVSLSTEKLDPSTIFSSAPTHMLAGQKLVSAAGATELNETNAELETLWRNGRVFFEDLPLREAVSEMARYSATPLSASDPSLDQFRINGMFRTNDTQGFVLALESYFPITITRNADGVTIENQLD